MKPDPHKLELCPPNQLRFAGREVGVGATVYLALAALTKAGGRLKRDELCFAVWRSRIVADRRLWSLCHRVSERLGEIGHPARCGADGGYVLLC
jgi:hypothetical protein